MTVAAALSVRIRRITYRAESINSFELVSIAGEALPPFTAGAHIKVHLPNGMTRAYSLHNRPSETHRYEIAVQREPAGRGGSRFLHDRLKAGDVISISPPCNAFELAEDASHTILIAGGIGVTPIIAMASRLHEIGAPFALHYCAQSESRLAFFEEAMSFSRGAEVRIHLDSSAQGSRPDVAALLGSPPPGAKVYCCGPAGLLSAVRAATAAWPAGSVCFESFAAPPGAPDHPDPGAFEVEIASTGEVIAVPPDMTMLEALRAHQAPVASSCEVGTCGACRIRYLEGDPDHQDFVLAEDEKAAYVMPCVSRSRSRRIKLDL